jgi:WD repeat-containing protein mio
MAVAGPNLQSRVLGWTDKDAYDVDRIIRDLAQQLDLPDGKGCETEFPEHRQVCLRICGAVESRAELEDLVERLVAQRQHTKAAALAVFQDEPKLAFTALRNNEPTQGHRLLAMAVAGAAKGNRDSDWEETCAEISKELTDPYARAILAFVSKGDWNSVLQETTLPLRYKVEVALRWLSDEALTDFLRDATDEVIQQGDIEGIVLTGLGHSAMDLFQSYINKFNDVQTPVLAMSHTIPRFVDDEMNKARYHAWRETYRWQMNSWKLQLERAKFDVGSRQFAITWDGRKLVTPPMPQISLMCSYCTRPLNQQQVEAPISSSTVGEVVHQTQGNPLGYSPMSGVVCPKCGRHMPRCGLCSLWLGTPDPMSEAEVAADAKKDGQQASSEDLLRRFVVFCINCNHGFHAHHAEEWFSRHQVCPVVECTCICDR